MGGKREEAKRAGQKVYRVVKVLPGESLGKRTVDLDYLEFNQDDSDLYDWCVEVPPAYGTLAYNPQGKPRIGPKPLYAPLVLEPGAHDLPDQEREMYVQEKMGLLSVPKRKVRACGVVPYHTTALTRS